jgi:branched-subunit amino acid aminotransferase/4-amino-4-deoxychorismate lyase
MTTPDFSAGAAFNHGRWVPIAEASIPMTDWGFLRSDACYDVATVWDGAFFRLNDHIERFFSSCRHLRLDPGLDGHEVGSGRPGPVTRAMLDAYWAWHRRPEHRLEVFAPTATPGT